MAPACLSSFICSHCSITGNTKPLSIFLTLPEEFYFVSFLSFLPDKGREILFYHPFYLVNFSLFILTLNRKSNTPTFPTLVLLLCISRIFGASLITQPHYFIVFSPLNSDVQFIYLFLTFYFVLEYNQLMML